MLNVKSIILNTCKRCVSLQHNLVQSGHHVRSPFPSNTRTSVNCLYHVYTQTRCHSTKQIASAGYGTKTDFDGVISPEGSDIGSIHFSDKDADQSKDKSDRPLRRGRRAKRRKEAGDHNWERPDGLDTGILLYNSLTRTKEPLILTNGRTLSWYQCGPTVYDHAHIGHASSYVRTDMIRRVLNRLFNIDVVQVMGVTDIDDKIIKRTKELRYPNFQQLAREYEASFFRDLDLLRVLRPTVKTHVTDHIPDIIRFVQQIIANGHAYVTPSGSVYFNVGEYPRYGQLKRRSDDDVMMSQKMDKEKRNAHDFALWKAAKPEEPYWESPFGKGRPGWHIECSTMASAVFGPNLDIHSGGEDLRFPHHENELAQSEACFCSKQWTNYWIHTGCLHLRDKEDKMSKSLKNTVSVHEMLSKYTPNQFRLFCMLKPYQQGLEYNREYMDKAAAIYNGWSSFLTKAESYVQGQLQSKPIDEQIVMARLQEVNGKVEEALSDDFDFPEVIRQLNALVDTTNLELNRRPNAPQVLAPRSTGTIASVLTFMERTLDMLGMDVARRKTVSATNQQFSSAIDAVVKFRAEVRNFALTPSEEPSMEPKILKSVAADSKDTRDIRKEMMKPLMKACDNVRDNLKHAGIDVNDHDKGSSWNMKETVQVPPPSVRKT